MAKNQRAELLKSGLYEFALAQKIDSKEEGVVTFKPRLAQRMLFDAVCEGVASGVHSFWVVKARQIGLSTACVLLSLYWLIAHNRVRGAMVTDTDDNREIFRDSITTAIENLPKTWTDGVKHHNRTRLELASGGLLQYLVAGARHNDRLGRARAINYLHATEVAYWGSPAAFRALSSALAENNPDRLYLYESTANGLNFFADAVEVAHRDPAQKVIFAGFWACEEYAISRKDPRFKEYFRGTFTDEEVERATAVKAQYGFKITPEQIAWHRWKLDVGMMGDERQMRQEYPWVEEEAFVESGDMFFPAKAILETQRAIGETGAPAWAYSYRFGPTYLHTEMVEEQAVEDASLLVWEQPEPGGVYVMGVDPAYGRGEDSDSHCISIIRCFADRAIQVAEYCTNTPSAKNLAWVISHLAAAYKDCIVNLEVTGPGAVVMRELNDLREEVRAELGSPGRSEGTLSNIVPSIRWYLYHRVDTMGGGFVFNWSTTADLKQQVMIQMRDSFMTRLFEPRSSGLLDEMRHMVRFGTRIMADTAYHDDRVMASALALRAWIEWRRQEQVINGDTWDKAMREKEAVTMNDITTGMIADHFARARAARLSRADDF